MKKILIPIIVVVVVLVLAGAGAGAWLLMRPQVITFSDDSKITLLSVDYGKHHAPPNVKVTTTTTNRTTVRRANGGPFNTTNDTLVFWVRQEFTGGQNQYHSFQYYIYDTAGTACAQASGGYANRNNEIVPITVNAFPRREGKFIVRVQEQSSSGQELADKQFTIRNPAPKTYSAWTADPLPSTKSDDDLSVTLTKLEAGGPGPYQRSDSDADDAMNKGVAATFHVERAGKAVSTWLPVSVETSDATGNRITGWNQTFNNGNGNAPQPWDNGDGTLVYQYGLWAGEPWKIRLEFSQQSDFADNEVWNLQNVAVMPGKLQDFNLNGRRAMATNSVVAETDLNDHHIKLFWVKDFTDAGPNNWVQGGIFFTISPDVGKDYRLNIKATDNQTNDIQCSEYSTQHTANLGTYRYRLQDIAGLTNLNVSIAIHKSRFVEFTAKPGKAAAVDNANN